MAKSITMSPTLGQLSGIRVVTSGFESSDLTINGSWVFGLQTYIAFADSEKAYLRNSEVGLVINLTDFDSIYLNGNAMTAFTDLTDFIFSLI